jgi:class I fructose-bisphosphate aldolase
MPKKEGGNLKATKSDILGTLFRNGKCLIIAYDQGFEHGPTDFDLANVDPDYVFRIAREGEYDALAVHAGIVEKYMKPEYRGIPLIIKLNGKTPLQRGDPLSLQHTSVGYAVKLGASAVGYTIYFGSAHEQEMFAEFGKVCEEAHAKGVPVVCWMYPRGINVPNEFSTEVLAHAARVAMEIGADVVKLKYNGDIEAMKWVVRCAGKTKVVIAGGPKVEEQDFLRFVYDSMRCGAAGMAIGRNAWQAKNPLKLARALREIVHCGRTPEEAGKHME